jgi:small multidrug resistance family-3 protein
MKHYFFIVLSLLWGWFIDKKRLDKYDWNGSCVALAGAAIIIWTPR